MSEQRWHDVIRALSARLRSAQTPIRILDSIKWDERIRQRFFDDGCRRQPQVDELYYRNIPLNFDGRQLRRTFTEIAGDIKTQLGINHPAANIMLRMCREYIAVTQLLEARGTNDFYRRSTDLFGSARDMLHTNGKSLADLGALLDESLRNINERMFLETDAKTIPTHEAVPWLQNRLDRIFNAPNARVRVIESDGIIADAAAGSDYIKLRKHAYFSERDLKVLEAHEGWVHVCTTLNGRLQPACSFLAIGTPSDTITQEGLAVFTEIISFTSHPARLRRIADRIRAIQLAEQGESFLDIFRRLCDEGRSPEQAYQVLARVFRGSTPTGGPFTKDLAYSKGFVQVRNYILLATNRGMFDRIQLMFCGKLAIEDMGVIAQLAAEGLITPPAYLPPPFADLNALSAWMTLSNFLSRLDLEQIESDTAHLFN